MRQRLKNHTPCIGTWLQIPSPDVAEIIACMRYDWAAIDMEHGAFTRSDLPNIFRALERWGTAPFVRLRQASLGQIKLALDSGAQGLIFPMISSRQQLDAAIEEALYPGGKEFSLGARGVGFSRANGYGLHFDAYIDSAHGKSREITIVAQIEHIHAVNEIDDIFSHPRLDAYMIGPYDLSASMGCTGDFTRPEFLQALKTIERAAEKHNLAKGFHIVQPDTQALADKIKDKYSFIAYGIDAVFLASAASNPLAK